MYDGWHDNTINLQQSSCGQLRMGVWR